MATTLVTVGLGVRGSSNPASAAADSPEASGSQAVPRPFAIPKGTAIAPGTKTAAGASSKGSPDGLGLPTTVYQAYLNAQARLTGDQPGCHLTWPVLAGIGKVESNQAHDGALDDSGNTLTPIIGPALDGNGFAAIPDTDDGKLDGDTHWDRAVGPMQFLPSTWALWGTDGNSDGVASPHNMYDAALTTGRYLCANGRDLSDPKQLREAILSYNRSDAYADTVTSWIDRYAGAGADVVPDASAAPSASSASTRSASPSSSPDKSPTPTAKQSTAVSNTPSPSGKPSTTPSPTPSTSSLIPSVTPGPSGSASSRP
ncbi:hypothetical protein [Streptomyces sp. NPDC051014]|uniref:lytic transglycosylase domain-containing protein n=1 Tax=Streptomyces sp. NPDC051014 TaxID=3155751 RepID=UPI0033E35B57